MDVHDKKVVIIGIARTSMALSRLIVKRGGRPFVTELRTREACSDDCEALDAMGIGYECGGHSEGCLDDASLLIPSPGVPFDHALCVRARDAGLPVVSELEFASQTLQSRVIAVTGTNGKTTTTELIAHLLTGTGQSVALAGNNDTPCSEVALLEHQPDYVVLEVSSYQLEGVDTFKPHVAVILNLSNDHLGRHGSMENYAATKARLLRNLTPSDFAILNHDDALVMDMVGGTQGHVMTFGCSNDSSAHIDGDSIYVNGKNRLARTACSLPGRHNSENILAALLVVEALNIDNATLDASLRSFQGVEHRIEAVREIDGVAYYNDSKATNLDSLKVALESFERPVVLIAGGEGKGSDYESLNETLSTHVSSIVAIGTDAQRIEQAWSKVAPVSVQDSMQHAVQAAREQATVGDIVLLSPACASFDMYTNFEERGRDFKRHVNALESKQPAHGAPS